MSDVAPGTYATPMVRVGLEGVNLTKALTDLSVQEASRLVNWVNDGGELECRPGQTLYLAGVGGTVHSLRRATDPGNGLTRLFWGAGTNWVREGAVLEGGFSGDPLTMIPIRKPQAAGSWMLVADRFKMRKAGLAATGSLSIGLPAPASAVVSTIAATYRRDIAAFDASDGTQASAWTGFAGFDDSYAASGAAPTIADVPGPSGSAVAVTLVPGGATKGFRSMAAIAKPMDLSAFQAGPAVTDDDFIHLQLRLSDPSNIQEVRLYLVCSPLSLTNQIPGTAIDANTAAYMHAFQPSDYEAFIGTTQTADDAAARAAGSTLVGNIPVGKGRIRPPGTPSTGTAVPRAGQPSTQAAGGANVWLEFSQIGLPLRRSDFVAIGTAGKPGTDWSTITGIYLLIWTRVNRGLTVSFDDLYVTGGAGPDTSEPGAQQYDWRYTHLDTRTGARGNGSPIQPETLWLDALRQPVTLDPAGRGDQFARQEFFRRGGSLTDNWYYVGVNTADGAPFIDTLADVDIIAGDTLPTENFQPVATLDDAGNTILNQPVPVVFGPIDDGIYCALGDPYRPGHLYSCIAGQFDAWPSTSGYVIELCAPSEELMNGCVWGGQGFVLSRERGYAVHANPSGVGIVATPTECRPGLAARWGFCHGPGGIFYVARDGVRVTGGQASTLLSEQIKPLFNGETVSGRLPVDFTVPTAIGLAVHNSDLWFTYQDTGGTRQAAVYSLRSQSWRFVEFALVATGVYSDETANTTPANRLLLGSFNGHVYAHEGFSDAGAAITCRVRTGAWFGETRDEKLLGDLVLEADFQGAAAQVTTLLNAEESFNPTVAVPSTVGRRRYIQQPFPVGANNAPQQGRSVSIDVQVTAPLTSRPHLYLLGVSVQRFPDVATDRLLAWSTWSSLSDKYLKGLILEADTYGVPVTLQVEADGVVVHTFTVTHAGRRVVNTTFPQVKGRVFRITPTSAVSSQVHTLLPIFDQEPYALSRWETQLLDLGLPRAGWGSVLSMDCCYRSTADVDVTIACYLSTGALYMTVGATLPSTGGAKLKRFVPLAANKFVLAKLIFQVVGDAPVLTLYQEESRLRVQPWDSGEVLLRPVGNDDLDQTRVMTNAVLASARSGGGT